MSNQLPTIPGVIGPEEDDKRQGKSQWGQRKSLRALHEQPQNRPILVEKVGSLAKREQRAESRNFIAVNKSSLLKQQLQKLTAKVD